jgi:heterodisulfide reductase subunit A
VERVERKEPVGAVLVLGAGIGGMQAALDLGESGYHVYLTDKAPGIGGVMAQLDKTFPTNDCAMCTMAPRLVESARHHNIELLTNAEVRSVEGEAPHFEVSLARRARYVRENKCTGCGLCALHCPVEAIDSHNRGLDSRRSIYLLYPQAIPLVYAIDREKCIGCGLCQAVCGPGAVDYTLKDEEKKLDVGAVILSLGFELFDPSGQLEYGYGRFANVVTSLEYERILSASGPFRGSVLRPSDGRVPRRIAFIQCIGSREFERNYCSSVCCMAATKHAIITREHARATECHIFYIDLRAFGKGFDAYYERAKKAGVRYVRSRPSSIKEAPGTRNLRIRYNNDAGENLVEEFDLVVLSAGLQPRSEVSRIAEMLGIELNSFGFCRTGTFAPLETTRRGIYVCGPFAGPKDIPETVTQASGSASKAITLLARGRGKLVAERKFPPERDVSAEEPRIGVFICHCGMNIGSVVDIPEVVKYVRTLPAVVHAEENLYTCSTDTQEKMKQVIKEKGLNRVVVASCTPRTHEPLFQQTMREAGLNPFLFEMANIRDQGSWVHAHEHGRMTAKAKRLVRGAVSSVRHNTPLFRQSIPLTRRGLVIGGGPAGMVASLDLANQGFEVVLVEREKELGGNLNKLHTTAERGDDPRKFLTELVEAVGKHQKIRVRTSTVLKDFGGFKGNFTAVLKEAAGKDSEIKVDAGIVIVATGGKELKPEEYLYGVNKDVLTQQELEEALHADPEKFKTARRFVMIQCVGSRCEARPYCSRVCCTAAVKHAVEIKELNPEADVYILYRDIRTYGFREMAYREAREKGVLFIRYDEGEKPEVSDEKGRLRVRVKDRLLGRTLLLAPDKLILSTATVPDPDNKVLAPILKVPLDGDNFFLEAHMKLRPVDFATEGIFLCGMAHYPKFLDETIAQASAVVARANTILSKDALSVGGTIAVVDEDLCAACVTCVRVCPYGVPRIRDGVAAIEVAACRGCGTCAGACPAAAIELMHSEDAQILAKVEGILAHLGSTSGEAERR